MNSYNRRVPVVILAYKAKSESKNWLLFILCK